MKIPAAKKVVLNYQHSFDNASTDSQKQSALAEHTVKDYKWRGMHPFYVQDGADNVAKNFWLPLTKAIKHIQRRQDIFIAGTNTCDYDANVWVCSMGHFMGLFDQAFLGIPPTGKVVMLRYAEFHCVVGNKIQETALFIDIISLMQQANCYPLPPQTGAMIIQPGPNTNDGLQFGDIAKIESEKTIALIEKMIADLAAQNKSIADCPPEILAKSWHNNMIWYGPAGIGTTYTIQRYQQQHQYPFRRNLKDKKFNGHLCRFAEGNYACFFGWPNLTNTPTGGFLGLPASNPTDMRVVDIYRRDGDKLAENWVFIDLLHYLNMQGLNILERLQQQNNY